MRIDHLIWGGFRWINSLKWICFIFSSWFILNITIFPIIATLLVINFKIFLVFSYLVSFNYFSFFCHIMILFCVFISIFSSNCIKFLTAFYIYVVVSASKIVKYFKFFIGVKWHHAVALVNHVLLASFGWLELFITMKTKFA